MMISKSMTGSSTWYAPIIFVRPIREDDIDLRPYCYCCRFPMDDFTLAPRRRGEDPPIWPLRWSRLPARTEIVRVKREQPRIPRGMTTENMPWLDLRLWQDQSSGGVFIVESWQHCKPGDDAEKGHYRFQPLIFPDPPACTVTSTDTKVEDVIQTLNVNDLPQAGATFESPRYLEARLGTRGYVSIASAFFDTRLGPNLSTGSSNRSEFHLTFSSCFRTSPLDNETGLLHQYSSDDVEEVSLDSDGERILNRGVYQFPPKDAPEALTNLLCPPERVGYIDAQVHDARSILYVTGCPDRGDKERFPLVLTNLDPWIHFPGLEKMELHSLSDHLTLKSTTRR